MFADFRLIAVDGIEADKCEIAFVVFRYAHAAFDGVTGVQIEAADLRGRNINIVRTGKIRSICAAQETEAVGQDFKCARAGKADILLHHLADDGKNEVLFAETVGVFNAMFFCHFQEFGNVEGLEF